MLAHAKKLFVPPVFPDDEDRTRAARVLNILLWSFVFILSLAAVTGSVLFAQERLSVMIILAFLAASLVAHLILRLHHVRLASVIFLSTSWVLVTILVTTAGGMSTAPAGFYLLCTVFCGLLLGTRAAVCVAALSVLTGLILVLLDSTGHLPPRLFPVPAIAGWADITIGLYLIIITIGIALDSIQDALSSARRELDERRKAEQALQRRTEEMEALREAAQVVGASLNVNEILRLILEQLKRVLVYDTASVVIFRQDSVPDLVVGLGYADEQSTSQAAGKLLQSSPILRRMSRDLQPIVCADVRDLEGWIWVPGAEHVRSWICIPLVARDSMIGALMVDHSQPGFYGTAELRIARSLAQHATQAIENARLYDETLRRNRELALLNRVIAASAAGQDPESVMEAACRELTHAFDLSHAAAVLFDRNKTQALVVAEYRSEGGTPLLGRMISLDPEWSGQRDGSHAPPRPIGDLGRDPHLERVRALFAGAEAVHLLLLPLGSEGDLMGSLALAAAGAQAFTQDQVNLAQRVADQVSGALARAWLEDEARELEEQFRQMQKMEALGRLAGGIAHDFNNLIAIIQLSSAMMERELHVQDPLRRHAVHIGETCERATRLVKQLLSFSRRDAAEPRLLRLQDVADDLSPMLRRILGDQVELTLSLPADLWPVKADPSQIEQVLINLIVNARDAIPEQGTVTVDMENIVLDEAYAAAHLDARPGDHVRLAVSDTGTGIAKEVQPHIFEPFFTTKVGKGMGLGLSTVFGIVTQSGGHIHVQSEVGQGTTFRLYFPRALDTI